MFNYILSLHIIFIVTWFAGMFYIVRLFIYNREAQDMGKAPRTILQEQYNVMIKRLWLGITWPSAILTLIFGPWTMILYLQGSPVPGWLWTKLAFVAGLYLYHLSLHRMYLQQKRGIFKYTSNQLRIWNEVATLFLFAIVFLVVLKSSLNMIKGVIALVILAIILMVAIRIYRRVRGKKKR
ncbi:MAG: protoporphyrinogen IX oxidase [Chitinophagaceae bacterium]|nr:MAG: protoporphyrinogen IX oxidase [Chitinophagaceae bacterium]